MRMGRRRTEKVLYRDEVDEDCEEKDCGGWGPDEEDWGWEGLKRRRTEEEVEEEEKEKEEEEEEEEKEEE